MIYISENDRPEDTYEHARALSDEQIVNERAVRDELDALESDLVDLWDDYYEIPYGSKYRIRIRTELPGSTEKQLYGLLNDDLDKGESDEKLIKVLSVMTAGIYSADELIHGTDVAFWENSSNWNMRKVESILMSYLGRLKEEREAIYSFPESKTTESTDTNPSDEPV